MANLFRRLLFFKNLGKKQRQEKENKEAKAKGMLMYLYSRYAGMNADEIIGAIREIYNFNGIPVFSIKSENNKNSWFFEIMEAVAGSKTLKEEHASPLAEMLSWPEIRDDQSAKARLSILEAIERIPSKAAARHLVLHKNFLQALRKIDRHGDYGTVTLQHELDRVEEILTACAK